MNFTDSKAIQIVAAIAATLERLGAFNNVGFTRPHAFFKAMPDGNYAWVQRGAEVRASNEGEFNRQHWRLTIEIEIGCQWKDDPVAELEALFKSADDALMKDPFLDNNFNVVVMLLDSIAAPDYEYEDEKSRPIAIGALTYTVEYAYDLTDR